MFGRWIRSSFSLSLSLTGFVLFFLFRFSLVYTWKVDCDEMGELCFSLVSLYVSCGTVHFENYNRVEGRNGERCVGHTILLYICGGFLSFLHWWIVVSCCLCGGVRERAKRKRWNGCARFFSPLYSKREFHSWLVGKVYNQWQDRQIFIVTHIVTVRDALRQL